MSKDIKDKDIHIRISSATKEKFEEICKKEKRSQSQQIEYWIAEYSESKRRKSK